MILAHDEDVLTHLLAVKEARIPPQAVRKAADGRGRRGKSLARALYEEGLLSEERYAAWSERGAPRKRLAEMVAAERAFWRAPLSADYGPYRAVREIAGGGRGVVLEGARADGSDVQPVAIKVLAERFSFDVEEIARFLREREILASIRHPGIIPVLETGWVGSIPFYVMAFVRGTPWGAAGDLMRAPIWSVVTMLSVLDVMSAVHAKNVVHCDMKPENVLLTPKGGVYLTDFGIARFVGECAPAGVAVGTPAYMSPEQAKGGVPLDVRTDVYSAGASLYEALTHRQPYDGETKGEIVDRVLEGGLVPPRDVNPEIPEPLERIVLKAMARNRRNRYPTAQAMAEDLKRWRAGERVSARVRRFWGRSW